MACLNMRIVDPSLTWEDVYAVPELYRVSERRMGQILDAKKFILNNYVERLFEK